MMSSSGRGRVFQLALCKPVDVMRGGSLAKRNTQDAPA